MINKRVKQLKLTPAEREVYVLECSGQCSICFLDGACGLQDKLEVGDNNSQYKIENE